MPDYPGEWRDRPPTREECEAHARAHGGFWLTALVGGHEILRVEMTAHGPMVHSADSAQSPWLLERMSTPGRWRPVSAEGLPVEWPVVKTPMDDETIRRMVSGPAYLEGAAKVAERDREADLRRLAENVLESTNWQPWSVRPCYFTPDSTWWLLGYRNYNYVTPPGMTVTEWEALSRDGEPSRAEIDYLAGLCFDVWGYISGHVVLKEDDDGES
jgi:hypothetical protein